MLRLRGLVGGATLLLACGETGAPRGVAGEAPVSATATAPRDRIDMHVHLVDGAVDELLTALDRAGIGKAVVLASPHLDPAHPPPDADDRFSGWREANDRLLAMTREHRERLLPFVTLDPAQAGVDELERWLANGACGVKLYMGHHDLRRRPLDDPGHRALFTALERRRVPVLLHVNTFRFAAELDELLAAHPALSVVCAHLCGSRTDLDRLERILRAHPRLLVDTSHGAGPPGVAGFTNLERERERLRAMISGEPGRFMFGSDLVTTTAAGSVEATRVDWHRQLTANLGLLERERFEFWRDGERPGSLVLGEYRGLALDDAALGPVLAGNARGWLGACGQ